MLPPLVRADDDLHCFTSQSAHALAAALNVNEGIRSLSLETCGLTDAMVKPMLEALLVNKTLHRLSLNGNCLTDVSFGILSEILQTDRCAIQTLQLGGNGMTCSGALLMADGIGFESSLRSIDLSYNKVQ